MNDQEIIAILKNPYADSNTVAKIREQIGYMNRFTMSKELSDAYLNT